MPRLNTCCCFSLKTGGMTICILHWVYSALYFSLLIYPILTKFYDGITSSIAQDIWNIAQGILLSIICFYGISKQKSQLILPFLIHMCFAIFLILGILFFALVDIVRGPVGHIERTGDVIDHFFGVIVLVIFSLLAVVVLFAAYVMYSLYMEMKKNNTQYSMVPMQSINHGYDINQYPQLPKSV